MDETDLKSIWGHSDIDDTRFGKVGIRIAEVLNFKIMQDATSQITNTAVIPILEQISEEILINLFAAAKENKVTDPWDFINANFINAVKNVLKNWKDEILEVKKILGRDKSIEITTVKL